MNTQKVFKAGNSNVVSIPASILSDLKIKTGDKVIVEKTSDETITIKKTSPNKPASTKNFSQNEFDKWLTDVLKEDAEILDELADR